MNAMNNTRRKARGQGMVEYIIIVALIGVAAMSVYAMFGKTIRNQSSGLAHEVAGTTSAGDVTNAGTSSTAATTAANKDKGMSKYNQDAKY